VVGECRANVSSPGKWLANGGRMYRVRPIFQNGHFGEYLNSPKLANFRRVLEFDKFAGEWPLLSKYTNLVYFGSKWEIPPCCNINSVVETTNQFYAAGKTAWGINMLQVEFLVYLYTGKRHFCATQLDFNLHLK
jgi:hypothetical protein